MYRFIFYFIYKSQLNQKNGGPGVSRIIASIFVFIAILFHVLFFYSITRFLLFNYDNTNIFFSMGKTHNTKLFFFFPIFLTSLFIAYKYFNKSRITQIVNQYENIKVYSFLNILIFFAIFVLPLMVSIILVNHSIN